MATVRVSMSMREDIMRKACRAFDLANPEPVASKELQDTLADAIRKSPLTELAVYVDNKMTEIIQAKGSGKIRMMKLHEAFAVEYKTTDHVTVDFRRPSSVGGVTTNDSIVVRFETPQSFMTTKDYYSSTHVTTGGLRPSDRHDVTQLCIAFSDEERTRRVNLEAYKRQLNSLLESCRTLKQLLEAWPGIKTFVPAEAMEAHERKAAPKTAHVPDAVEFDAHLANTVAVKAKLRGGVE